MINLFLCSLLFQRGDYTPRAEVIIETMKVVQPPVEDFAGLGFLIEYLCHDLPTYWLIKTESHQRPHGKRCLFLLYIRDSSQTIVREGLMQMKYLRKIFWTPFQTSKNFRAPFFPWKLWVNPIENM